MSDTLPPDQTGQDLAAGHTARPRVAVIGCGGTISTLATDPLDYVDYVDTGRKLSAAEVIAHVPDLARKVNPVPVERSSVSSSAMGPQHWIDLRDLCREIVSWETRRAVRGIVILHGTGSLEETATFLDLTLSLPIPVVVVGAQRPLNTLSSDAPANLLGAVMVATDSRAKGRGVMVVADGTIHAAREVHKGHTSALDTFTSLTSGPLGSVSPRGVHFFAPAPVPLRRPFSGWQGTELPRVDIVPCYGGADETAVTAFIRAGARGLISAGFAPGLPTPAQRKALEQASRDGIMVVQASRADRGCVSSRDAFARTGFIAAGLHTPIKARLLLALALAHGLHRNAIAALFADQTD